ncbi:MAG: hypothetical protein K2Z81_14280 [Cyanobacteria bacterium]|nr:hypothetical protein [Cyanobacteriota bacterium]
MVISQVYIQAGHPDLSESEIEILASHEDHKIRVRIAEHKFCVEQVLARLANDGHEDVRIAVSENPATPDSLLCLLARDQSCDVRYAMASNYNLPRFILEFLAGDSNPYVVRRAMNSLLRLNPVSLDIRRLELDFERSECMEA